MMAFCLYTIMNNNNNNNNNNLRLFNCRHRAIITVIGLTSATQGGTQQPPRRAAYTEGLSRLNWCHTRRTAIESTAPA